MFKPVLGLDLGMTTLGICVSRSGHITTSLENLKFPNGQFSFAYEAIFKYIKKENIGIIVLGRPSYPSLDPTEMTFVVEDFYKRLKELLKERGFNDIKVEFQDEQGSTLEASQNLHNLNMNSKEQKAYIDENAAKVILERWLIKNGYDVW